ncbi:hypothetical protein [Streptomyces mirabilis]|uniref:hypothetical protein n=1 Tax=Streptomyces mirabilis TaxID=68239 RepID=UPI0033EA7858
MQQLVAAGWTISAISRRLNLDRKTVRRFRDTDLDQLLASANERRPAEVLEPFKPYISTRFAESLGQVSGSCLFLEIRERGYWEAGRSYAIISPPSARATPSLYERTFPAPGRSPAGS